MGARKHFNPPSVPTVQVDFVSKSFLVNISCYNNKFHKEFSRDRPMIAWGMFLTRFGMLPESPRMVVWILPQALAGFGLLESLQRQSRCFMNTNGNVRSDGKPNVCVVKNVIY